MTNTVGERRAASARESGRSYLDRHARAYERSLRILGRPLPRTIALVQEAVVGAEEVLEVGAGTGVFTNEIAPRVQRLVATDYAAAMVELLRDRVARGGFANVECARVDLYSMPFEPGRFDVVVAANVLHVVPDLPSALRALHRVLRPGGRLVAPTFCHDQTALSLAVSRLLALTGFPGHRRFTSASLRNALEGSGLRIGRLDTVEGIIPITYIDGVFETVTA